MNAFDRLAEQRIQEAIAKGELDDLPGAGTPLRLEDLSGVPEELRTAYVLLKNANVLPEEMQLRKDMLTLGDLIAACDDDGERAALSARLRDASIRFEILIERRTHRRLPSEYRGAVLRRLVRGPRGI